MNVLVIVPRYSESWGEPYQIPLGLGYIASTLKKVGHVVSSLNLNHYKGSVEDLVSAKVSELNPDVCASGSLAPFLPVLKVIYSASRKAKPDIINIAGGGLVSGEPEMSLRVLDIDIGVVNEGEATIKELLQCLEDSTPLADVKGIVFKDEHGETTKTGAREQIKDLGQIPWPDYELLETEINISNQRAMDSYFNHSQPDSNPRIIDMISSRSCPYSCTFCFHPVGKVYRERPLDDFFAELDMVVARYKINMVAVIDELFSLRQQRLLEFCERIKPYNLQWMVQLHVMSAKEETLKAMYEAGCTYISYGIESMSRPVLISMQKKAKPERIASALALTYEYKIGIQGNLLFGDKAETLETASESMHWWAFNRRYQVNLTPIIVFPGSPDYYDAIKDGLIKDREDFVVNPPTRLNISRMNDINLEMMSLQVWAHQNTLLNIAPLKVFKVAREQTSNGAATHDIIWDCPGCKHQNKYLGVSLPPGHGPTLRLTCRSCLSRWDIENKAYHLLASVGSSSARTSWRRLFRILFTKIKQQRFNDVTNFALSMGLSLIPPSFRKTGIYRWITPPEYIFKSSISALGMDPLNPEKHNDFAEILIEVGAYGAARMHYQQALSLNPDNVRATSGTAGIDGADTSDQQRSTYFASWSDAPPPVRKVNITDKINLEHVQSDNRQPSRRKRQAPQPEKV